VSIEITVECNQCGTELEAYGGTDTYGNPKVSVVPGEVCKNEAVEEAISAAND